MKTSREMMDLYEDFRERCSVARINGYSTEDVVNILITLLANAVLAEPSSSRMTMIKAIGGKLGLAVSEYEKKVEEAVEEGRGSKLH